MRSNGGFDLRPQEQSICRQRSSFRPFSIIRLRNCSSRKSIMETQEASLLALLFQLIGDVVFLVSRLLTESVCAVQFKQLQVSAEMTSSCMAATSCSKASRRSSANILSHEPLNQETNVHDSPRVRSNSLRYHVGVKQCDDTIFSSRFEPEDCMRTFSQSEPTRLLSSLQSASLSQQHRRRAHRIQGPYHHYPQVPTISLVPCATLLNTVPIHFTHDGTQRVATKPDFRQQTCINTNFYHTILLRELFGRKCRCCHQQTGCLARTMGQIVLPARVSPFSFDKYCVPHTHLRLLRRY